MTPTATSREHNARPSDSTPVRITFGDIEVTARLHDNATGARTPLPHRNGIVRIGDLDGDMAAVKRLPEGARVTIEPTG